jgi:hypothetical protein
MELEVTWRRTLTVWWALVWRSVIALVAASILGGIVGGIMSAVLGAMGYPPATIQGALFPIGFFTGLAISVVPVKLILTKDFGEFRLVLMAKSA